MTTGRDITLFSGYDQKENRTTNYAILLLKMLYEENPSFLDEALSEITGGQTEGRVGVQFRQQQRRSSSVPDAVILQEPITLFVETKNTDWFYDDQLERHLEALAEEPGLKVLIALSRFDSLAHDRFESIQEVCRDKYEEKIAFAAVPFEKFAQAVKRPELPKRMIDVVEEFEEYLEQQDLLPTWKHRLDACNCSTMSHEQVEHGTYICPATGGAYTHQRARFFGMYRNKRVDHVAAIRAVVDVEADGTASIYYKNVGTPDDELFDEARAKRNEIRPGDDHALRIFLLGPLYETDFRKDSPGGMMGSKQYFSVKALSPNGVEQLAQDLRGKPWSQFFYNA